MKKNLILLLVIVAVVTLLIVIYTNSRASSRTEVFSSYSLLESSWQKYKQQFILPEGRVIDPSQNDMTTSEGQSYAMLRAVWSDDKPTFDLVWNWTKDNLDREQDKLFGWRWGQREDGSYGFLENGGENSATDADTDIALALIFAANRWNQNEYRDEALPILTDLWNLTTEEVNGKRYALAGSWATSQTDLVLNPSYFAPYAWRIFADVDTENDWESLIDPAYEVLRLSSSQPLNGKEAAGLPPNWVMLRKQDGQLIGPTQPGLTAQYSYDAMRTPWRIAVDYHWFAEPQALEYLQSLSVLGDNYRADGFLASTYEHDGTRVTDYESPAMYATALPYFQFVEPETAQELYQNKVLVLYDNDTNAFREDLNYYDQNWLWFSMALYNDSLPNLAQKE